MSRVVVLGAAGGIGSVVARTLTAARAADEIVLADRTTEPLQRTAADLATAQVRLTVAEVDADDPAALRAALDGATVAVSTIGPFYRYGPPVLAAAIAAGVDYVDVCDDLDPTLRMLDQGQAARDAGVCAVIGMGNSPGLANVLVRYCADTLLDVIDTVDIAHVHGGEPAEGPAVLKHRIHAMTSDIPVWDDGAMRTVRQLEPSGTAYTAEIDFRDVGILPAYPYPHPETVTLPRYLPGVRRVTNRGVVTPLSYFQLTQDLVRAGVCGGEPLEVAGRPVVPLDFSVAHLIASRPRLLAEAGVTGPSGCLRVAVTGRKDDLPHEYVFSLSSTTAGAGEGTGIPAALAALLMLRGEITEPGVHAPEAVVDPVRLLALAGEVLGSMGLPGTSRLPIHVDHTGPDGQTTEIDLAL